MAQMKEQIKTTEKELSDEERGNLPDADFKPLVIRMLTELTELSHKMKEEMKAIESEVKDNIQGTNSKGKETRTQINVLEQKEEINTKKQEWRNKNSKKKKVERFRNLQDNCKHSNLWIIGMPEEEEEQ